MSNSNSSSNHFTCPSGGSWYACPNEPHFIGCCSSDPCTNVPANSTTPCPDIYPASFDPSIFNEFRPNACIGAANSNWITCNFTNPPFLGCCSINTYCNDSMIVCPDDDLLAAAWSPGQYALFQDKGTDDDDDGDSGGGSGLSGGAIAGIVVGAVAALVIVGLLVWFFMRRRNKKAAAMTGQGNTPSVVQGEHQSVYPGEYGYQHPSPASASYDSRFSSPAGTNTGAGRNSKYMSTSSAGTSLPSLSPAIPSESGRQIHEIHSIAGSETMSQHKWASSQNYGLGMHGAQKPEPIQELDGGMAQTHELEAGSRP
ncbi:hypothetical protein N7493_003685 [Penicillium malachiteum]|uniref:Uncharacterized protein n=1 Tax=Penicillium malachiteum TaxID=1324776 RepID=A0AAD6HQ69_9EURO|nr:hypothetical protein N7493_003685 [Penicillium malachiteum]